MVARACHILKYLKKSLLGKLYFLCRSWKVHLFPSWRMLPIVVAPAGIKEDNDISEHNNSSADKGKDSVTFFASPAD